MVDGKKSTAERSSTTRSTSSAERTSRTRCRRSRTSIKSAHAGARGALPPRRRRHLPGARRGAPRRARTLAVRWLVEFAAPRREKTMAERLAGELVDAQSQQGGALQAQGRHLPHGAGQQGLRPLPLVASGRGRRIARRAAVGAGRSRRRTSRLAARARCAPRSPCPDRRGLGCGPRGSAARAWTVPRGTAPTSTSAARPALRQRRPPRAGSQRRGRRLGTGVVAADDPVSRAAGRSPTSDDPQRPPPPSQRERARPAARQRWPKASATAATASTSEGVAVALEAADAALGQPRVSVVPAPVRSCRSPRRPTAIVANSRPPQQHAGDQPGEPERTRPRRDARARGRLHVACHRLSVSRRAIAALATATTSLPGARAAEPPGRDAPASHRRSRRAASPRGASHCRWRTYHIDHPGETPRSTGPGKGLFSARNQPSNKSTWHASSTREDAQHRDHGAHRRR